MNDFPSNINKFSIFFCFFTKNLTLLQPLHRWVGHNTNLLLDSNLAITLRKNIAFAKKIFKEYSISFPMVCRLIDLALIVLTLLVFKVCVSIGISKIEFFNFFGTERFKKKKKKSKIKNI